MRHTNGIVIGSHRTTGRQGSIALFCALLLAAGTVTVVAQEPAPKDLRLFYQQNCAGCHGTDGTGLDSAGKRLRGQDFTDANWRKSAKDDEMVKVILKGKFFGLAMPAFKKDLTPEEALRMVTEIVRKSAKGNVIEPEAK